MNNKTIYTQNLIKLFRENKLNFDNIPFFQKQGFIFICEDGELARIERSDEYVQM